MKKSKKKSPEKEPEKNSEELSAEDNSSDSEPKAESDAVEEKANESKSEEKQETKEPDKPKEHEESRDSEEKTKEELEKAPNAPALAEQTKSVNPKVATLVLIVLTTLTIMATNTFYDQGILLIAGIFLFLGAYPAIKLDIKDPTKKFSIEMALIFTLCMVLFVILRTVFPESFDDKDHAKIVIIILTVMAARLIVWPIYTFKEED